MAAKLAGGGGGRYDLGQNSDINVTPFVDILLVLLIIFMVAIPMATVSIKLDLPPPSNQPVTKKPIFLSLQKDGKLILSPDKETSFATVAADLKAAGQTPDDPIMVRADADVSYGKFMGLLNQLQGDGFMKVGLISEDLSMVQ